MNKLDPFEKLLNAKLQNNEVELNFDSWNAIEKKLPSAPKSNLYYWIGAAIMIGTISAAIIYFNNKNTNTFIKNIEDNSNDISQNNNDYLDKVVDLNEPLVDENISKSLIEENTGNANLSKENSTNNNTKESEMLTESVNKTLDENSLNEFDNNTVHNETVEYQNSKENETLITEKTILKAEFSFSNNKACIEDPISFNALQQPNVTYLWDLGDGNFSDLPSLEHQYNEPGIYYVQLTVNSETDSNVYKKSSEFELVIHDKPSSSININSVEENGIPFKQFSQSNNDLNAIVWDFGDGSKSTEFEPIHRYLHKGNYLATLDITDENNCSNSFSRSINVEEVFNLMAPNTFTPNGDGINDNFIPESLKIMDVEFTMTIFNKFGKRLYQTKNINQPWEGIDQNSGQKCQEGNYLWVVQLINKNGETEQYKGAILLLN